MITDETYHLVTFSTTSGAIQAEKALMAQGMKIKMIPIPGEISAGCGLSIAMRPSDTQDVKDILNRTSVEYADFYEVRKQGAKKEVFLISS